MSDKRDYFAEAVKILRGESMMIPQFEHLEAMAVAAATWSPVRSVDYGMRVCDSCCRFMPIGRGNYCPSCREKQTITSAVLRDREAGTGERDGK